jgi:hypothetical protein
MIATKVSLDCDKISDWRSFHEKFAKAFGFPDFYGRNMNAWINCMTYVDDVVAGMSTIHCERGSVLVLELLNVKTFWHRSPQLYEAVVDGLAFVNWRRQETGDPAKSMNAQGTILKTRRPGAEEPYCTSKLNDTESRVFIDSSFTLIVRLCFPWFK